MIFLKGHSSLKQCIAKRVDRKRNAKKFRSNWFGLGETAVASFNKDLPGKNDVYFEIILRRFLWWNF